MLRGHCIKHSSNLQSTVSLSSGESEFLALVKAGATGLGVKATMDEWHIPLQRTTVHWSWLQWIGYFPLPHHEGPSKPAHEHGRRHRLLHVQGTDTNANGVHGDHCHDADLRVAPGRAAGDQVD